MRNLFLLLVLSLLPQFVLAQQIDCVVDSNCEVKMAAGKKEGKEICRALDNPAVVMLEANYSNGLPDGSFICRSFIGFVTAEGQYTKGKKTGEFRSFHPNEKNWLIEYYKNDKIEKLTFKTDMNFKISQYISGSCIKNEQSIGASECLTENFGSFDSQVRPYLQKQAASEFKAQNQEINKNYDDGKPELRAHLVNGKFEGKYQKFFDTGKIALERTYLKGDLIEEKEYFKEGQLAHDYQFKDRRTVSGAEFFQNGHKSKEFVLKGKSPNALEQVTEYYDTGNKYREYTFMPDEGGRYYWISYVGEARTFSQNGEIISIVNYNTQGKRDGRSFYTYGEGANKDSYEEIWKNDIKLEESLFVGPQKTPKLKTEYFPDGSVKKKITLNGNI